MVRPVRPVIVLAGVGTAVAAAWTWCLYAMICTLPVTHGPIASTPREERPTVVEAEPVAPIEDTVERRVVVKPPRLGGVERPGGPAGPPGGITGGFGMSAYGGGEFGGRRGKK